MAKRVPRRMRRFEREGELPPQEDVETDVEFEEAVYSRPKPKKRKEVNKEITMQLALDEVQRFKEEHKRLPRKGEYDRIAESIYGQLRDERKKKKLLKRLERRRPGDLADREGKGKHKRIQKRGGKARKKSAFAAMQRAAEGLSEEEAEDMEEEPLSEEEIKGMSVEDLFAGEGKSEKAGKKKPSEDEFGLGSLTGFGEEKEEEFKNNCPNCGLVTEDVIFCPECGTAFCENCAKKVEKVGKFKTIVCPSCKKRIKK